MVAHGLQGGERGDRDGGRLVEGQGRGSGSEGAGADADVLGERAGADAEHLVARLEAAHAGSHRVDGSGEAPSRVEVLRPAQSETRGPDGVGQAGHDVPGSPVHAGRVHEHADLVVPDRRPGDRR